MYRVVIVLAGIVGFASLSQTLRNPRVETVCLIRAPQTDAGILMQITAAGDRRLYTPDGGAVIVPVDSTVTVEPPAACLTACTNCALCARATWVQSSNAE